MIEETKPKLTPALDNLEMALKTWFKQLKKFVMVYVWSFLYSLIPALISMALVAASVRYGADNGLLSALMILGAGLAGLVAMYFAIRGQIGAFLLIKKDYAGDELDIYKETRPWFWPYLGLSLLSALFVLLWSLLLIIPGIIYAVFYSFAAFVFFFEDKRGRAAIRRSTELVTGYWWPVFGRLLLVAIFIWAILSIVSWPLVSLVKDSTPWHLYNSFVQLMSFLVGPIVLVYSYNIYQDLIKLKAKG